MAADPRKTYVVGGKHFLYKEGEQPTGAKELKQAPSPQNKAQTPQNKSAQ